MRSEVSHPTHLCPQSLRKRDRREKPRNLLQSDEQCPGAPLSHLCNPRMSFVQNSFTTSGSLLGLRA